MNRMSFLMEEYSQIVISKSFKTISIEMLFNF